MKKERKKERNLLPHEEWGMPWSIQAYSLQDEIDILQSWVQ